MLAADTSRAEFLEERLSEIGRELAWLSEVAERDEATWHGNLRAASGPDDLIALSQSHALLGSWVLAPLRAVGSSYESGDELRTSVTRRVLAEIPGVPPSLPSRWRPVVVGWTLGMVVGSVDQNLPVAPALLPADANARAACEGLVEHVLHLGTLPTPWPEIVGTATYWRGTGLAEGLKPEAENGYQAIKQLIFECRYAVPDHLGRRLSQHFEHFAEQRNTLSHVADMPGKPRFVEVMERARDWSQIHLTIMGITQFLCAQIALELA